jgi:multidrug resistance efflux pump
MLRAGILAFQAGDRATARRQLAQAALADPDNADAWLWLGRCVDDPAQQQECWDRVERLNQHKARSSSAVAARTRHESTLPRPSRQRGRRLSPDAPIKEAIPPGAPAPPPRKGRRRSTLLTLVLLPLILVAALVMRFGLMPTWASPAWTLPTWMLPTRTLPTCTSGAQRTSAPTSLVASGIIQANELSIASEYGGLIASIPAADMARSGETIHAGDPLVRLDTTVLDAQIEAARAGVSLAEANLAQAKAGARPGQIAVAEAELFQAQQARLAATQAVSDTAALVANPQEIRLQIALLEAQVEAEQHRLAQSLALKDAAEIAKDAFKEAQERINDAGGSGRHKVEAPGVPGGYIYYTVPSLPLEAHLAPNRWWQAWVGVNATAAQKEGLEASLAHLYAQRQNPQAFGAQADQARAALAQADAQVLAAQAQLDGLRSGATTEEIAALQARVDQAQAALDALLSRRDRRTISAPADGVVLDVVAHPGEIAAPGATLLTLADLSRVRLTVYVPEPRLGEVHLGQSVQVTVDSFPERAFQGRVARIADRAEFTPRNVATREERANLVFAVEIDLPNEDGALKPGMPADAAWR